MNLYKAQIFSPIVLIVGVFLHVKIEILCALIGVFLLNIPFLHNLFIKFGLFFLLGLARNCMDEKIPEFYTYKSTSFKAYIEDVKVREYGIYLVLKNIKYKEVDSEYKLDESPVLPKRAQMKLKNIDVEYYAGQEIVGIGRFFLPMPGALPGSTSIKIATGEIKEGHVVKESTKGFKFILRKKFDAMLDAKSAQIAKAIFLGDSFAIAQDVRQNFQKSGLAHLLGVSILNITVIAALFYYLFRYFILRMFYKVAFFIPLNVFAQICALQMVVFYCYLVGFEFPLLRSLFISCFAILSMYFGKNRNLEALLWAAAFILFVNQNAIYDIGFQLSFGGVFGLYGKPTIKIRNRTLHFIADSMLTSFFASLILTPISFFHFQSASLQPFLANFIAIPYVSFVLTPMMLIFVVFSIFNKEYLVAIFLDYALYFFERFANFMVLIGLNYHIDPFNVKYLIIFLGFMFLFVFFKTRIRYFFISSAFIALFVGFWNIQKRPFILIHPHAVAYVMHDKIYVTKRNFIAQIWESAYNVPAVEDKNMIIKESSGKIIIDGKYGLIFDVLKSDSIVQTQDYHFTFAQMQEKVIAILCV